MSGDWPLVKGMARMVSLPFCERGICLITVECAYGLRYVERSHSSDPNDKWRVRQAVIYQNFRGVESTQTWLFLSASQSIKKAAKNHMQRKTTSSNWNPFDLHIDLIAVALVNWRWYIKSLVEQTEGQVSDVFFTCH